MKEKEPFDLAFQEVTRDKGGIRNKIAKTSRNLVFNYSQSNTSTVATGVAIDSLGIGSFVGQ